VSTTLSFRGVVKKIDFSAPMFYLKTRIVSFAGVLLKRVPPFPIPNREVKAFEPDDTHLLGESRVCQHMKLLVFFCSAILFFFF